jgi:hypothetical protein
MTNPADVNKLGCMQEVTVEQVLDQWNLTPGIKPISLADAGAIYGSRHGPSSAIPNWSGNWSGGSSYSRLLVKTSAHFDAW